MIKINLMKFFCGNSVFGFSEEKVFFCPKIVKHNISSLVHIYQQIEDKDNTEIHSDFVLCSVQNLQINMDSECIFVCANSDFVLIGNCFITNFHEGINLSKQKIKDLYGDKNYMSFVFYQPHQKQLAINIYKKFSQDHICFIPSKDSCFFAYLVHNIEDFINFKEKN